MKKNTFRFLIKESNVNFHTWMLVGEGFTSPKVADFIGDYIDEALMYFLNGDGKWATNIEKWNKLGKLVLQKLAEDKLQVEELIEKHHEVGNKLYDVCDKVAHLNLKDDEGVFTNFLTTIWNYSIDLNMFGIIPVLSDFEHNILSSELLKILRFHNVDETNIQSVLSELISMNRETLYWREELELLDLTNKFGTLDRLRLQTEFKKHIDTYFWLNFGYVGPVWSEEDFIGRVEVYLQDKKPVNQQYSEHKNKLENLIKEQENLEKEVGLSAKEIVLFKTAREFMYLKAYRMEVRHRTNYIIESIFSELAKRYCVSINTFRYMTCDEILTVLDQKEIRNSTEFLKRRKKMLYVTKKGGSSFVTEENIDDVLEAYLEKEVKIIGDKVHGQIAYRGNAKGVVSIINSPKDIGKIKKGEVLITISTNPDLLPAMNKAVAFVTDVGGITSHAAIVAREMKKPCVIGTKHATKIFKDGDMVEVDADKGIVKKV